VSRGCVLTRRAQRDLFRSWPAPWPVTRGFASSHAADVIFCEIEEERVVIRSIGHSGHVK